nr:39S ribosomal protein L41-A, mitochondrial-like [Ipomoea batatas]
MRLDSIAPKREKTNGEVETRDCFPATGLELGLVIVYQQLRLDTRAHTCAAARDYKLVELDNCGSRSLRCKLESWTSWRGFSRSWKAFSIKIFRLCKAIANRKLKPYVSQCPTEAKTAEAADSAK